MSRRILIDILVCPGEEISDCTCPGYEAFVIEVDQCGVSLCTSHHPDCDWIGVDQDDLEVDHDHWAVAS